jgi:hydrogenase maturation protease
MTAGARVVALGQPAAGDDGAGCAVLEALRERGVPDGVRLERLPEPSALVPLLAEPGALIVLDAVVGPPPGQVLVLSPEELARKRLQAVSSHGLGVAEALELGRALASGSRSPPVRLIAVAIPPPERHRLGLSPEVAAAVPEAAARVLELLGEEASPRGLG